jgi:hypothetical protein
VRERLLGGTLELHGVDVEHVASKELRRTLHKLGGASSMSTSARTRWPMSSQRCGEPRSTSTRPGAASTLGRTSSPPAVLPTGSGSDTDDRAGFGPVTPTNGNGRRSSASSSRSATALLASEFDWETLSERSAAILRLIALPMSVGFSEVEIASELGISRRSVSILLDELREELGTTRPPV